MTSASLTREFAQRVRLPLERVEDGMVRSVALESDLTLEFVWLAEVPALCLAIPVGQVKGVSSTHGLAGLPSCALAGWPHEGASGAPHYAVSVRQETLYLLPDGDGGCLCSPHHRTGAGRPGPDGASGPCEPAAAAGARLRTAHGLGWGLNGQPTTRSRTASPHRPAHPPCRQRRCAPPGRSARCRCPPPWRSARCRCRRSPPGDRKSRTWPGW